ncbi:hypothetical protein TSUD_229320 [Trifolium subterraneum]|uniref:Uncharacterized protein n=1 Tax=Trifolium subterraneum TaxID=3900 RepID=A0A2Z6LLV9_TRISU|nr:hypothetical protein TSUD_229320 [Trifolium subterraneum]
MDCYAQDGGDRNSSSVKKISRPARKSSCKGAVLSHLSGTLFPFANHPHELVSATVLVTKGTKMCY